MAPYVAVECGGWVSLQGLRGGWSVPRTLRALSVAYRSAAVTNGIRATFPLTGSAARACKDAAPEPFLLVIRGSRSLRGVRVRERKRVACGDRHERPQGEGIFQGIPEALRKRGIRQETCPPLPMDLQEGRVEDRLR